MAARSAQAELKDQRVPPAWSHVLALDRRRSGTVTGVIVAIVAIICAIYLVRWSYLAVIKRERIDMTQERMQFQRDAIRGIRVSKRAMKWWWKASWPK